MKYIKIFSIIFIFHSCSGSSSIVGKYKNSQGAELIIKNTHQYLLIRQDCQANGKWSHIPSENAILFENWIDDKNQQSDKMITFQNNELWVDPDNRNENFRKI